MSDLEVTQEAIDSTPPAEAPAQPAADDASTDLEIMVPKVLAEINKGSINLSDLLKRIARKPKPQPRPEKTPLPAAITKDEQAALERFYEVFGKVQPTTRRALNNHEIERLMDERLTLDVIEAMIAKRKASIRTAVFNHFDVEAEKGLAKDEDGNVTGVEYDKDGHLITAEEVLVPKLGARFVRQVSEGGASVTTAKLKKLVEEGVLTNKDFLAMTVAERVVSEPKVLLHMRKNPAIVTALGYATELGRRTISFYAKPQKKS